MKIYELVATIAKDKPRSTFGRGVKEYALEMLGMVAGDYSGINGDSDCSLLTVSHLLNHVEGDGIRLDMAEFPWGKVKRIADSASRGGNFLIYDEEIVERLRPPSRRPKQPADAMGLQTLALIKAIGKIRLALI